MLPSWSQAFTAIVFDVGTDAGVLVIIVVYSIVPGSISTTLTVYVPPVVVNVA